jgi:hypothetical protein
MGWPNLLLLWRFYHTSPSTWPNWAETVDSEANPYRLHGRKVEPILAEKSHDPW